MLIYAFRLFSWDSIAGSLNCGLCLRWWGVYCFVGFDLCVLFSGCYGWLVVLSDLWFVTLFGCGYFVCFVVCRLFCWLYGLLFVILFCLVAGNAMVMIG